MVGEPSIAARYVRTDPQAAVETMAVFTRFQSFPCKPGPEASCNKAWFAGAILRLVQ